MFTLTTLPIVVVVGASLIAAATDLWNFKIYNSLTMPLLISGLIFNAIFGGWAGVANSAMGFMFGFFILILFYGMGGMGAGDVKLMAGIGAWLGMPLTFYVFIASALAGGVYAIVLLLFQSGLQYTLINMQILWLRMTSFSRHFLPDTRIETEIKRDDRRKRLIPYASMVALGVIATYFWMPTSSYHH